MERPPPAIRIACFGTFVGATEAPANLSLNASISGASYRGRPARASVAGQTASVAITSVIFAICDNHSGRLVMSAQLVGVAAVGGRFQRSNSPLRVSIESNLRWATQPPSPVNSSNCDRCVGPTQATASSQPASVLSTVLSTDALNGSAQLTEDTPSLVGWIVASARSWRSLRDYRNITSVCLSPSAASFG